MMTPEEDRASLETIAAALKAIIGAVPSGYISPGLRLTPNTLPIVSDFGYCWQKDFEGDEVP